MFEVVRIDEMPTTSILESGSALRPKALHQHEWWSAKSLQTFSISLVYEGNKLLVGSAIVFAGQIGALDKMRR